MPHVTEHHPEQNGHSRKHKDRRKYFVVLWYRVEFSEDVHLEKARYPRHYCARLIFAFNGNQLFGKTRHSFILGNVNRKEVMICWRANLFTMANDVYYPLEKRHASQVILKTGVGSDNILLEHPCELLR